MNICINSCIYYLSSPESILGQDLTGVRVCEKCHPALLDKQAQLLRHHTAALEVNLAMENVMLLLSTQGPRTDSYKEIFDTPHTYAVQLAYYTCVASHLF